ncbi:MAG: hypothetical protein CVU44_16350 [Chloroflexi bacterium HGW-Chloroflexi-6]|nr:MAG: hypothetical protein CVU44_16350 [Chloroflexi bacterium HGW-Chloroflexi-6]
MKGFSQLLLLAILINILAQAAHETGHMLVCHALNCNPTWGFIGLVQRWEDGPPSHPENWQEIRDTGGSPGWFRVSRYPSDNIQQAVFSAGGPVASIFVALIGLWQARKSARPAVSQTGLMLCLVMSLSMSLYYLRNPLRPYGDEYDIAYRLELSQPAIVIVFTLIFLTCMVLGLRSLPNGQDRLRWLGAAFLGSALSGLTLNLSDGWVREMVNQENRFFVSVFGYSLPVLLIYLLAGLGIWLWCKSAPANALL